MTRHIKPAIIGEFTPSFPPHAKTNEALNHVASALAIQVNSE